MNSSAIKVVKGGAKNSTEKEGEGKTKKEQHNNTVTTTAPAHDTLTLIDQSDYTAFAWKLIDKYFIENPYNLVAHHLDSYNNFFSTGIYQIFNDNNPVRFIERDDGDNKEERNECFLYMGGKSGRRVYLGKPIIYDESNGEEYPHYMYPNDARLRNMTYAMTIHYDVDVDFIYFEGGQRKTASTTLEKIFLGRFPIMLHSNMCILRGMSRQARFYAGECLNDTGGYFIIDGKEKAIVSQEKFGDNMLYVRKGKPTEEYNYSCEIHSVSEDTSKPIRYTAVRMMTPSAAYTNRQIVVDVPNVRKPVPLFILMRALGILSDKDIISTCLLDIDKNKDMMDLFIPSVHDANIIFTQELALQYISTFTKRQSIYAVHEILMNYFLPHIGEDNYLEKAYFIGYMVYRMLRVVQGREAPTDRDSFKFKRIELSGTLIYDLFREYFLMQNKMIWLKMDREFYFHVGKYRENFTSLVEDNVASYFGERLVEDGFRKGFKGNWGATANTKRLGLVQDLNRLSWFTYISQVRKINLPLDPTSKVVGPHLLHSSQWGYVDPVDTPDGGNIGLHKHLSISTAITSHASAHPVIRWMRENTPLVLLCEATCTEYLAQRTKVFVNGNWIGVLDNPLETVNIMRLYRRNGILPIYTSISFNFRDNCIYIYTDSGRLTRPVYYRSPEDGKMSYDVQDAAARERVESGEATWQEYVAGFYKKDSSAAFDYHEQRLYSEEELYPELARGDLKRMLAVLQKNKAIIDYLDCAEEECSMMINAGADTKSMSKYVTHMEIDMSFTQFGVMGNSIIFPEYNQFPRDVFSCGQSRQAVSLYHANYAARMDKMGVVLNYGQVPLIKSRYLKYINNEEQPYGVNAIVAIMSYTGYNVEDAILINRAAVDRGLFRTTYYTTYETREESERVSGGEVRMVFTNIEQKAGVVGIAPGYDYSKLDEHGIVKENTKIDDRTVLIGNVMMSFANKGVYKDHSKFTKKGQLGFVDKSFMSEGEEGFRIAKVRIREERMPAIGDKMASRAGQKGTIGLVIPEENMPYTEEGIRPDLIINPHAIPSRMTIGQLVECVFGKGCAMYGAYGDCTAYASKGSNYEVYGSMLTQLGYHKSGCEIMYSGFTGEQLHADIFIGPTYYMRLKHMVKDKINYRSTGKRSMLTRQTNQGRANDGGLRLGEMERDGILGNGMMSFLYDSFMTRGDAYSMAVCNKTGMIAVYNSEQNLFISPSVDGPLQFHTTLEGKLVLDVKTKHGRSFSLLRIPYCFKLLWQELLTMNVCMRLITEDNIDQIENLSFRSRNIDRLLGYEVNSSSAVPDEAKEEIKDIIDQYKARMTERQKVGVRSSSAGFDEWNPSRSTYNESIGRKDANTISSEEQEDDWNEEEYQRELAKLQDGGDNVSKAVDAVAAAIVKGGGGSGSGEISEKVLGVISTGGAVGEGAAAGTGTDISTTTTIIYPPTLEEKMYGNNPALRFLKTEEKTDGETATTAAELSGGNVSMSISTSGGNSSSSGGSGMKSVKSSGGGGGVGKGSDDVDFSGPVIKVNKIG